MRKRDVKSLPPAEFHERISLAQSFLPKAVHTHYNLARF